MDGLLHRGGAVAAVLALALLGACGGDNSVSSVPAYDANAVTHTLAAMIASGEFQAPKGGPVSPNDQEQLLKLVEESCKGPGKIDALIHGPMQANPYLLAMTMKLIDAGCPKLLADMGIKVNG